MDYLTNTEIQDFLPAELNIDTPKDLLKPLRGGVTLTWWRGNRCCADLG